MLANQTDTVNPVFVVNLIVVTQALAANEFYVVQNITTMECSIAEQKPTEVTMKVVGPVYDTQVKAAVAIKANKSCDLR